MAPSCNCLGSQRNHRLKARDPEFFKNNKNTKISKGKITLFEIKNVGNTLFKSFVNPRRKINSRFARIGDLARKMSKDIQAEFPIPSSFTIGLGNQD